MALYKIFNGPMPTTASQAAMATTAAIKTLMQVQPSATNIMKIREWGISFDGSAAATPGIVELCETDTAATVTAYGVNDIHKFDSDALMNGNPTTNLFQVGTANSGYGGSAENAPTLVRQLDVQHISPMNQYVFPMPLGVLPVVQVSKFMRIRCKFAATVNTICYVLVEV